MNATNGSPLNAGIDPTLLVESTAYADPQLIRQILDHLREHQPVCYVEPERFRPFWAATRYDDIRYIESTPELFSAEPRAVLIPESLEIENLNRFGDMQGVKTLVHMDGPQHLALRAITRDWFMPKNVAAMRGRIDVIADQFIDRMRSMGGECDFAADIAFWYPLRVVLQMIGISEEDEPTILNLTQRLFAAESYVTEESDLSTVYGETLTALAEFFTQLAEQRRNEPVNDIASVLANANVNGEPLDPFTLISYFVLLATAGHDTTSASLAGGVKALLDFPEQHRLLLAEPGLYPGAADEMIRWVSPVKHFARTVLKDTTLSGVSLKAGETVAMFFDSANRDGEAIASPAKFDIKRDRSRHLAFGVGRHNCPGMHLARLEIAVFLEKLLPQLEFIEQAGEPAYIQSGFVSGLNSLPVRYRFRD
ncbi:cytochrome P450 [Spongiibacter sp. KMU-166]|uniref:Cytochrome P450 n=1 Tax=Spongiibacter thalassae TaxID=2721624 RepID=A0ABX1GLH4_9GAMM|nr:cytochrome P450 [Spongiibacter thalassae]NKI19248.1 cytochrome P450 [Spongiibacter thalassae]